MRTTIISIAAAENQLHIGRLAGVMANMVAVEGIVHVFDLEGNPSATRAHAWSSPVGGSDRRRFFAVLHMGAIKSPVDAVRAAIVAEHRRSTK
jgi:hypothetical protein